MIQKKARNHVSNILLLMNVFSSFIAASSKPITLM